jgi:acyl-CoA synthetase (AMP-forming)/AMP-acid ligase II
MSVLRMPDIVAHGRWRSGDELDAIARGWLAVVRDTLDDTGRPVAVALPTTQEGVALLVALTSLPSPVILLPPDVRAWRTEPAIPLGTPLVLLPTLAHLVPDVEKLGLTPVVLPETSTRAAGPPIDPFSGTGIVLFTSGSLGSPKPVYFPMATTLAWVRNLGRSMGLGPGAGVAVEASPAYAQGLTHLLIAILLGGPLGLLDPRDHRLALATLAEPVFQCWRASRHFVDALTSCVLTGPAIVPPACFVSVPIPQAVFDAFLERFGVPLRQMYSLTETGTVTLDASPADRVQHDTVGRPLHRVEVHIGDHPAQPAPPDEIGRIWVRGPWQMAGYGFPPHVERPGDVDGWWPTQDLGRLRADGYLVLAGRRDDAIRTRENRVVNLTHVTASLRGIVGVTDAVVLAIDTPSGRSFGAVVECDEGLTVAQLRTKLAETLPPWSWPRALDLVPALPRLPNGKPDRQACAGRLTAAPGA